MASDTRERLIAATGRLLRRQGYAATGLNEIVAAADAPKGSMYFHFPGGKEELAAAAVTQFADTLTSRLTDGLARAPVADAVAGFFDAYIEVMERTEFRDGCAVATVALDEAATHEQLAQVTRAAFTTWVGLVADALGAQGYPSQEASRLATLVIASIEGSIVMAKGSRSSEPLAASRDALHTVLAQPVRTR